MNPYTPEQTLRRVQAALTRARSKSYGHNARQAGRGHWLVTSSSATRKGTPPYHVTLNSTGYCYGVHPARLHCNCQSTGPCDHAAKVALRLQREAAGGRKRAPRVVFEYTVRSVTTEGAELFDDVQPVEPRQRVKLEEIFS